MRAFPVSVLLLSVSVFPHPAKAITISELPGTIQACVMAGDCVVDLDEAYGSGSASAFQMTNPSTGTQDWLMRYALVPPSGERDSEGVQSATYGGYLWMQAAAVYSASETEHGVTLFLDKVTPVPKSLGSHSGQDSDLLLFMTSADLLAGGAYRIQADSAYSGYDAGTLSGDIPLICLAEGCEIEARLNLLQLNYAAFGEMVLMTGFDASDARGLVYSQSSYYFDSIYGGEPPYGTMQTFYITAVPEPGMAWLLGIGLLGVSTVVRSRRTGG